MLSELADRFRRYILEAWSYHAFQTRFRLAYYFTSVVACLQLHCRQFLVENIGPIISRLLGRQSLYKMSSLYCTRDSDEQQYRANVYRIATILRYKLVADLVRPIVDYAGFFNYQTSKSDQYLVVRHDNSPATCLQSEEISCRARTIAPVREITFTIMAKDQGYGAWPGSGQWTWFSAAIMKCGSGDLFGDRLVARNSLTPGGFATHQITWSSRSGDKDEVRWVKSLEVGDRVVVQGHSDHSGWSNFVKFVQVTVSTVVVVR